MNENLDLTKILDRCPEGTKFYSPIFGEVSFVKIEKVNSLNYPIKVHVQNWGEACFSPDGYYYRAGKDAEAVLFPSKDQRDWNKFERFWDKPNVERFDVNTLVPFNKVLVRNNLDDIWRPNFFGYINNENHKNISCFGFCWKYCIPYNEETKHLVGTKDDCPEYYKWWEE